MKIDTYTIAEEYIRIFRGEHSGYTGDKVYNADSYLFGIGYDFPDDAKVVGQDMVDNAEELSNLLGCTPTRIIVAGMALIRLGKNFSKEV